MVLLRRLLLVVLFVGAAVGGATFSNENESLVSIHYIFGRLENVPLWIALIASFTLGVALCLLVLLGRLTRASLAQRRYRKTVAKLESEVHQLRNLPLEEAPKPAAQLEPKAQTASEAVPAVAGEPARGAGVADPGA